MATSSECLPNLVKQVAYYHALGLTHKEIYKCLAGREYIDSLHWLKILRESIEKEKYSKICKKSEELSFVQFCDELASICIGGQLVQCLLFDDVNFPPMLKRIHNPPAILYFIGKLSQNSVPISIVGSRDCSPAGESITRAFVRGLSKNGVSIISGGALGIDAIAHEAALDCGLHTVAILGSSLDCLYPISNEQLFNSIVKKGGAVVSHFPLGTKAAQYTFPIRNELIAGWSVGTLVTEARERSGSLITAGLALDSGRLVFSVPSDPGRVNARGGNILIRDTGAKCVLSADDVYSECIDSARLYGLCTEIASKNLQETPSIKGVDNNHKSTLQSTIFQLLSLQSYSIDQISEQIGISISDLIVPLGKMEILGTIKRDDFGNYHQTGQ